MLYETYRFTYKIVSVDDSFLLVTNLSICTTEEP